MSDAGIPMGGNYVLAAPLPIQVSAVAPGKAEEGDTVLGCSATYMGDLDKTPDFILVQPWLLWL